MNIQFPFPAFTLLCVFIAFIQSTFSEEKGDQKIWTDPVVAAKERPDFSLQGEYTGELDGKKTGVQAASLDHGKFLVLTYQGGLPGAGWTGGALKSEVMTDTALRGLAKNLERIERRSPTLGKKAPEGALVLFAGKPNPAIKGEVKDGLLWAGSETLVPVGDFHMHLEFRLPFKPCRRPSSQDRGNSGVYIFNNYEIQVLDSFALDLNSHNNAIRLESLNTQWCGSFYKVKLPDVPMTFPPLTWQTYDFDFTAPRFDSQGKKTANARATVWQNGVMIHHDVELKKGTGAGAKRPEKARGTITFQGHGNPTAFRNIWLVEKKGGPNPG